MFKRVLSGIAAVAVAAVGIGFTAAAATATSSGCVEPSASTLFHTYNPETMTASVKVVDGKTLCTPLNLVAATYAYDLSGLDAAPAIGPSWPQTLVNKHTAQLVSGTVWITAPARDCAQHDIYASTGAISLPPRLNAPGEYRDWNDHTAGYNNGEPPYVHDWTGNSPKTHTKDVTTGCQQPAIPAPTKAQETMLDCDKSGVRTVTTTYSWTLNNTTGRWEKVENKTYGDWTYTVTTPAQKAAQGCSHGEQPHAKVVTTFDQRADCFTVEKRAVTSTTPYVFDESTWTWVEGKTVVTEGEWTKVRDTTAQEKREQGCVQAVAPEIVQSWGCDLQGQALLTAVEGLQYAFNGEPINGESFARDHDGAYIIEGPVQGTITVTAEDHFTNIGPESFEVDLAAAKVCATPVAPEASAETCLIPGEPTSGFVTIPETEGVRYLLDNEPVEAGRYEVEPGDYTVTAEAVDAEHELVDYPEGGYVLNVADVECEAVPVVVVTPTPEKPQPKATPVKPQAPKKAEPKQQAAAPVPEALAYTGVSNGLWIAAGLGVAALLSGGLLLFARRLTMH